MEIQGYLQASPEIWFAAQGCYKLQDPDITFYSVLLPVNMMVQIGILLLVINFWTIGMVELATLNSSLP